MALNACRTNGPVSLFTKYPSLHASRLVLVAKSNCIQYRSTMANPPTQFGQQQWAFITKTRAAIKNDPRGFFAENNWRNITPTGGKNDSNLFCRNKKTTVDAFYVRPICCWVPHLLISNHMYHHVPRCKLKDDIDLVKSRWINFPKVLIGVSTHRYLDTMLYYCAKCDGTYFPDITRSLCNWMPTLLLVTLITTLGMAMPSMSRCFP